jgi:hypothetical protein
MTTDTRPPETRVIPLDPGILPARLTPLRQVEAYWTALAAEGGLPARARIDPRALENVLDHVLIAERIAPGIARLRITGAVMTRLAGMEPRGLPLSALFSVSARAELSRILETVFDAPAVAEIGLRGGAGTARMILLPMLCDAGRVNRVLGAVTADARLESVTFDITEERLRPVYAPHTPTTAEAAEDTVPFAHAPHLRLVRT